MQETGRQSAGNAPQATKTRPWSGLSARLLWLTFVFVTLAEILIFLPSIANMRLNWLSDRLNTAAAASVVVDGLKDVVLPKPVRDHTLMATDTKAIVLTKDGMRHLIAMADMPPTVDYQYNLDDVSLPRAIYDAFDELLFGGDRVIRVFCPINKTGMKIEVVMADTNLRAAMITYSRNVLLISMVISLISAGLIFMAINRIMIRPIRRLTNSIERFSQHPEEADSIFEPGKGADELAAAGRHLQRMQKELQKTLRQQKNLAELGLAVSKINHDMRNILASAQLISDRLGDTEDPMVKRLAPKLLRTIDRAVSYSDSVLSFGRASEAEPKRRLVRLKMVVQDVLDVLTGIGAEGGIGFDIRVPDDLTVDADPDQLFRVIHNLVRNAVQALMNEPDDEAVIKQVTVSAYRTGSVVSISVDDTGPGMPQKARENLFKAFRGSTRSGGTGLGLAIARELVLAHGGTIALVEKAQPGTLFRIEIPDRPIAIDGFRRQPSQGTPNPSSGS
ncbi:sensor histidine kinase [Rhizobium sp. C1]|uniref:sensor histidine kinase n=1 Tax=Rhizobium sp. C1 TaxID=1349799 RepID=UPI001E55C6F7|nr:HAMP domain-containing sensor histidine kinase [Rhizobium sp. C1]MCD2179773.1 HAMP domain-containing histidine kinase [Rhizobium sp. C1]